MFLKIEPIHHSNGMFRWKWTPNHLNGYISCKCVIMVWSNDFDIHIKHKQNNIRIRMRLIRISNHSVRLFVYECFFFSWAYHFWYMSIHCFIINPWMMSTFDKIRVNIIINVLIKSDLRIPWHKLMISNYNDEQTVRHGNDLLQFIFLMSKNCVHTAAPYKLTRYKVITM